MYNGLFNNNKFDIIIDRVPQIGKYDMSTVINAFMENKLK